MLQLKKENQFDTLHIKTPLSVFDKIDFNKFDRKVRLNSSTLEMDEEDLSNDIHWFKENGKGLNAFTIIPHQEMVDIQISGKILREDYYKGIGKDTIKRVIAEIENRGVAEITDASEFIIKSSVRRADNTFNVAVPNPVEEYYEAINLVASKAKLGKVSSYENDVNYTGIVLGKESKKIQKLTIYNKLDEAIPISKTPKFRGLNYGQSVEEEYGMKVEDFDAYFKNKLRVELRVNDYQKLRKFYTKRTSGLVFVEDLIFSKNNAILYQYNQMVNEMATKSAIDFLNLTLEERENSKRRDWRTFTAYFFCKQIIKELDGDEKKVLEKIEKLFYDFDEDGKKKKFTGTVKNQIVGYCAEYKEEKLKANRGELVTKNISKRYNEFHKSLEKLTDKV
jgi:hypothetical protein